MDLGLKGKVAIIIIIPASALVADSVSLYMQHSRSARAIGLFRALRKIKPKRFFEVTQWCVGDRQLDT